MPYIKEKHRAPIDQALIGVFKLIRTYKLNAGEINYLFTKIMHALFKKTPEYTTINDITGAVVCAREEFGRKVVAPYEDKKIKENGDLKI